MLFEHTVDDLINASKHFVCQLNAASLMLMPHWYRMWEARGRLMIQESKDQLHSPVLPLFCTASLSFMHADFHRGELQYLSIYVMLLQCCEHTWRYSLFLKWPQSFKQIGKHQWATGAAAPLEVKTQTLMWDDVPLRDGRDEGQESWDKRLYAKIAIFDELEV